MNIGIIGTGMIVPTFLEAAAEVEGIHVRALCGRATSQEKTQQLAEQYGIARTYSNYAQMLEQSEIDTIYVAVPNHLHYEFTFNALRAEKNVIVEKPFASNQRQAEALIAYAREQEVLLFEAVSNIYNPNYGKIKELLPNLGEIKIVQINLSQYSSRYDRFIRGECPPAFDPEKSGGALMDLGVYTTHFIVGLFGIPVCISYHANVERGIDTSGILMMEYPKFQCVSIVAKDCEAPPKMRIQGTQGYIESDSKINVLESIAYQPRQAEQHIYDLRSYRNRLCDELKEFARIVRYSDHEKCCKQLEQTMQVIQILDEGRQQAGIIYPE